MREKCHKIKTLCHMNLSLCLDPIYMYQVSGVGHFLKIGYAKVKYLYFDDFSADLCHKNRNQGELNHHEQNLCKV